MAMHRAGLAMTVALLLSGAPAVASSFAAPIQKSATLASKGVRVSTATAGETTARLQQDLEKAMLALYMHNAQTKRGGKADPQEPGVVNTFNSLESFGREDTAAELTDASIVESNAMVDQIERAVVAETKRSMFRALTRLRGTTIESYDSMANAQGSNLDAHVRANHWRDAHQTDHLAVREGDVETWAFPSAPSA
eukprot:TRINITY_DN102399_c0_g1_i1.p1 TRINITY_DN102399_c0_g1~~TRINITY_DN102399_c0_g1_i1.p1  ORF type:complete len:195 (+),score=28.23 TRINITY_DN102399_c0_g1_i1:155-739(+)